MFKSLVPYLALCPILAFGDTVILRDGTRYTGTFISGTSRQIVFADESTGRQRRLDNRNVQEIAFGDAAETSSGSYSNSDNNSYANGRVSDSDRLNLLGKLRDDLDAAISNGNLSNQQRRSVNDSKAVLESAIDDQQAGRTVNTRALRLAIDNIRNLVANNSFADEDRRLIGDDLQRLREAYAAGNSRNDNGTRSRYRQ